MVIEAEIGAMHWSIKEHQVLLETPETKKKSWKTFPLDISEGACLSWPLDYRPLASRTVTQINFYCFKQGNLWKFVRAALANSCTSILQMLGVEGFQQSVADNCSDGVLFLTTVLCLIVCLHLDATAFSIVPLLHLCYILNRF